MTTNLSDVTVCVAPWTTVDRTLYVDLKAFLASVRYNRNVLSTRVAVKSKTNVALDECFILPKSGTTRPATGRRIDLVPGNAMTIVSANRPVGLKVSRESGELDLGTQTLFIITSSIASLEFTNVVNEADVEINVITV